MSDFKYKDEVVLYPYEPDPQIYYISMIYQYEVESYLLKSIHDGEIIGRTVHGNRIKHCTPEMKTKILLGIPLEE